MKESENIKQKHTVNLILLLIGIYLIWQIISFFYPSIIFPSPEETFKSFLVLIEKGFVITNIIVTLKKLILAQILAVTIGCLFGIIMGIYKNVANFVEPVIYILQSIPPILYMTLAMIWFGLNGKATIFIVVIGCVPIMTVTIEEGFNNIDKKLIEMGHAFKFSKTQNLMQIVFPSLIPYLKSSLITILGLSWKLVIMGEVLSAGSGIGAQITDARNNLRTDFVFAWGSIVILLSFIFQKIVAKLLDFKPCRKVYHD